MGVVVHIFRSNGDQSPEEQSVGAVAPREGDRVRQDGQFGVVLAEKADKSLSAT